MYQKWIHIYDNLYIKILYNISHTHVYVTYIQKFSKISTLTTFLFFINKFWPKLH